MYAEKDLNNFYKQPVFYKKNLNWPQKKTSAKKWILLKQEAIFNMLKIITENPNKNVNIVNKLLNNMLKDIVIINLKIFFVYICLLRGHTDVKKKLKDFKKNVPLMRIKHVIVFVQIVIKKISYFYTILSLFQKLIYQKIVEDVLKNVVCTYRKKIFVKKDKIKNVII